MDKTSSYEQIYLLNSGVKAKKRLLDLGFSFDLSKDKDFSFDLSKLKFHF